MREKRGKSSTAEPEECVNTQAPHKAQRVSAFARTHDARDFLRRSTYFCACVFARVLGALDSKTIFHFPIPRIGLFKHFCVPSSVFYNPARLRVPSCDYLCCVYLVRQFYFSFHPSRAHTHKISAERERRCNDARQSRARANTRPIHSTHKRLDDVYVCGAHPPHHISRSSVCANSKPYH